MQVQLPVFTAGTMFQFKYRDTTSVEPVFHSHTFYEVYYFHEGKCNYLIGDQIYALAPGDLILMYGMTLHCAKTYPNVPYVRTIVHFDPALVRPFAVQPSSVDVLEPFRRLKNYRLCLRGTHKAEAERILGTMREHQLRNDRIGESRLKLAFVDLLHFVYDLVSQPLLEQPEFPSEKEKAVQEIVAFLETAYTEDLHMEQLQNRLHLSKSYLAKIFKDVTGVTIFEYVYRKRINEARMMFLLKPDIAVTEVCFQLGFKHLAHFSRMFKRHAGMSPEQFKKQVKKDGLAEEREGYSLWEK